MADQSIAANTTDPPARCIFCGERDNDECEQCVRKMKRRAEVAELRDEVESYFGLDYITSEEMADAREALDDLAALAMESER